MTLTEAIGEADACDIEVALLADALWASEVSGHPRRSLTARYESALRAAIAAWHRVSSLSAVIGDDEVLA